MRRDVIGTMGYIFERLRSDGPLEVALLAVVCIVEEEWRVAFCLFLHKRFVAELGE